MRLLTTADPILPLIPLPPLGATPSAPASPAFAPIDSTSSRAVSALHRHCGTRSAHPTRVDRPFALPWLRVRAKLERTQQTRFDERVP